MDGCFVERRFQINLSIAAFKFGLGLLTDIAISFNLTVKIRLSTTQLDL